VYERQVLVGDCDQAGVGMIIFRKALSELGRVNAPLFDTLNFWHRSRSLLVPSLEAMLIEPLDIIYLTSSLCGCSKLIYGYLARRRGGAVSIECYR
jgi:hypothetical protein